MEKITQDQIEEMIDKQNSTNPRNILILNELNLSEINFSHLDLNKMHFLNCFFDKVYLEDVNRKDIKDCSFKNCNFTKISSSGDINIFDSKLTDNSLGFLKLNKLLAYDSKFINNKVLEKNIGQVDLRNCELVSSDSF
ncbi:hypothetical protein OZX60_00840 [Streptococcaceae bacterium ESL0687]|nr:hypothetical protein OZX60_00840 [Streptococcaceae bacterium ESL0687]